MDRNRIWMLGSVLGMVVVLAIGLLLGVQPQLAAIATADEARVAVETSNVAQSTVLAKLKTDFATIDALKGSLAPLEASVPSGTNMSSFVNQLNTLAGTTKVTFSGLTVSPATPYAVVGGAAPLAQTGATATAPAAGAVAAGAPPVTSAQITAANFASLAVQITVSGSYASTLDFVNGLQTGERLVLVTGLSTTAVQAAAPVAAKPGTAAPADTGDVTAIITALVYVLVPPASAAAAPVTPSK
jgi:Tfp pilus assembly protein PilO